MTKRALPVVEMRLNTIVGGGQTLGTTADGLKVFVWGGLPGERVKVQLTKKKRNYAEAAVVEILEPSSERVAPQDPESFLSTSPWQIMTEVAEHTYKTRLITEAFSLHSIVLPQPVTLFTDNNLYGYRNKVEFSFWWDKEQEVLDLAFFKRGSHGKVAVVDTSLAMPAINQAAGRLLHTLRTRGDEAYNFKTVIIRATRSQDVVMQLYVKEPEYPTLSEDEISSLGVQGFELVYSNPKSPASVITERLQTWGDTVLRDEVLGTSFTYTADSFFQVNLPVYEQSLTDIREWILPERPTLDLYSGSGSLGLSVTKGQLTLVEINAAAIGEAANTIRALGREENAAAIHAPTESVLQYITPSSTVIVDPPRAGLHSNVVDHLLRVKPPRIIYLSCNPVTQARDVARLLASYEIRFHKGYNFFPRTPHIEHLIVLDAV